MKLATLKDGTRDGTLIVVSRDLRHAVKADDIAPTLQAALDELGPAWGGGKLKLPLVVQVNGEVLGRPDAGVDMTFEFPRLIAHSARTRPLAAGTIVGSGTVSNADQSAGAWKKAHTPQKLLQWVQRFHGWRRG